MPNKTFVQSANFSELNSDRTTFNIEHCLRWTVIEIINRTISNSPREAVQEGTVPSYRDFNRLNLLCHSFCALYTPAFSIHEYAGPPLTAILPLWNGCRTTSPSQSFSLTRWSGKFIRNPINRSCQFSNDNFTQNFDPYFPTTTSPRLVVLYLLGC